MAVATRGRRLFAVALCGFFALSAGWGLAAPYNGYPDELSHVIRAAGVASGQILADQVPSATVTDVHDVPAGLVDAEVCWQFRPKVSAACGSEPTGETDPVTTPTTAGRYPPAYYAAVGWAMVVWPSWTGVLVARLLTAAMVAGLLAAAAYAAARWSSHRLLPAGVLVATTPITVSIAGGVNPSGVEIAAGTALFVALVVLRDDVTGEIRTGPLRMAGLAALVLAVIRPFGPLWLCIIAAVFAVPVSRRRLRELRDLLRVAWRWALGAFAAVCGTLAWMLVAGTGAPGVVYPPAEHLGFLDALRIEVVSRFASYANQLIGILSWVDTPLPSLAYPLWFMSFGALFLVAIAAGQRDQRLRLLLLGALTFGVPAVTEAASVNTYGFVTQGRYVLPIAVGLPILAAWTLSDVWLYPETIVVRMTRTLAVVVVPIQLGALWYTMLRWQWGLGWVPGLNPLSGEWLPPLGPVLPAGLGAFGAAALLVYAWRASVPPSLPPRRIEPLGSPPEVTVGDNRIGHSLV